MHMIWAEIILHYLRTRAAKTNTENLKVLSKKELCDLYEPLVTEARMAHRKHPWR